MALVVGGFGDWFEEAWSLVLASLPTLARLWAALVFSVFRQMLVAALMPRLGGAAWMFLVFTQMLVAALMPHLGWAALVFLVFRQVLVAALMPRLDGAAWMFLVFTQMLVAALMLERAWFLATVCRAVLVATLPRLVLERIPLGWLGKVGCMDFPGVHGDRLFARDLEFVRFERSKLRRY